MIGRDESGEEVVLKVNDRRKFNVDGSLRDGVEIEPVAEKAEITVEAAAEPAVQEAATTQPAPETEIEASGPESFEDDEEDLSDIPGAEDPASFVNFLSTLASQAAASLGAMPHPVTGQRSLDLEGGRYWIDVLAMLKEKTKGNLGDKEARLLDGLLSDLRMQYVQLARLAEEKLKQQAAQKFSSKDILGKK
jgi:hypothetical protein